MKTHEAKLLALFSFFIFYSCGKNGKDLEIKRNKVEREHTKINLPEKFQGDWKEYQLEKSILFEVCNARTIKLEQGGTEFFWMTLGDKLNSTRYKIHRIKESEGAIQVYSTPNGSLEGTDTTLVIMEPVANVTGVMRIRQFGKSGDYPEEVGTIYFVGDSEMIHSNPPTEACPD